MKFKFAHNNFNVTDLDRSLRFYICETFQSSQLHKCLLLHKLNIVCNYIHDVSHISVSDTHLDVYKRQVPTLPHKSSP